MLKLFGQRSDAQIHAKTAHWHPRQIDRLNTLHFRIPVIDNDSPPDRTDRIVLLVEPTTATGEEPAFYLENRCMPEDPVEDFYEFYAPLEWALIARLQARNQERKRP